VIIGNCPFADDVLYDVSSATWVRFEGDGTVTVGVTSILAWLFGPVSSVSFKPPGTLVEKGNGLGGVESPRHFDIVRSPITGKVVEANQRLIGDPRLLNRHPYAEGWFARLAPLRKAEEGLLESPASAREGLRAKIAELKIRCFAEYPDNEMYEIGTECSAVLARLDELFEGSQVGTVVHLVSDDPSSEVEMARWTDETGNRLLETRREGNLVHYLVKKTAG